MYRYLLLSNNVVIDTKTFCNDNQKVVCCGSSYYIVTQRQNRKLFYGCLNVIFATNILGNILCRFKCNLFNVSHCIDKIGYYKFDR